MSEKVFLDLREYPSFEFSSSTMWSGERAWKAGDVFLEELGAGVWKALVKGSRGSKYLVFADVSESGGLDGLTCECEASSYGLRCFHQAALVIALKKGGILK